MELRRTDVKRSTVATWQELFDRWDELHINILRDTFSSLRVFYRLATSGDHRRGKSLCTNNTFGKFLRATGTWESDQNIGSSIH